MFLLAAVGFIATSVFPGPKGYWSMPRSGHGRGVLVLHAWWGLNGDVKAYCRRLSAQGFVAYAPDMFVGKIARTPKEAQALANEFDGKHEQVEMVLSKGVEAIVKETGGRPIGVVGFSYGANYALSLSNAEPERVKAVAVYYGTGPQDFSQSQASYLGNFAEHDQFEPKAGVDELAEILQKAKRPLSFETFSGVGHWFAEPSVKAAYNKEASEAAWKRTLKFLKTEIPK